VPRRDEDRYILSRTSVILGARSDSSHVSAERSRELREEGGGEDASDSRRWSMVRLGVAILTLFLLASACRPAFDVRSWDVELTVTYEEPRVNTDGSPLTDLKRTTVYGYWKGHPKGAARLDIPASKPTGGGTVSVKLIIPVQPRMQGLEMIIYTTASDERGNESRHSNEVTVPAGRLKPPAPR
jgi:hypothetical protein